MIAQPAYATSPARSFLISSPFEAGPRDALLLGPDGHRIKRDGDAKTAYLRHMQSAFDALEHGSVRKAGRYFQKARETLDEMGSSSYQNPLYVAAAFGEAIWANVNNATFNALERIQINFGAKEKVLRRERLMRALAYSKTGHDQPALKCLTELTPDDSVNDALKAAALVSMADIRIIRGLRRTHHSREVEFGLAHEILTHEIPVMFDTWAAQVSDNDRSEFEAQREITADILYQKAVQFRTAGYHLYAQNVFLTILKQFASTQVAQRIREGDPLAAPYLVDGHTRNDVTMGDRILAAGLELTGRSSFPTRGAYWKTATFGSLAGAALMTAVNGGIDYPTAMQAMGSGALAAVALRKLSIGIGAAETRQAYKTGHTDVTVGHAIKNGASGVLRLMATYAFFGGAIPGMEHLSSAPVAKHFIAQASPAGAHLKGIGSFLGWIYGTSVEEGQRLFSMVAANGWGHGTELFWDHYRTHTVFGSSLDHGIQFWQQAGEYARHGMVADLRHALSTATETHNLASTFINGIKGVAGAYALGTMILPQLREWLLSKYPKALPLGELAMLLGAYALAADINLALGVRPIDSYTNPFLGVLVQLRHHTMGGGRANNVDYAAVMRGMLIPTLYTGTGAKMSADPSVYDKTQISHLFANSMGIQVFLLPIGIVHAWLAGLDVKELLKGKVAKSWREESIGNSGRLALGWSTFWGTAFSMVAQQIALQPWISSRFREITGTPSQWTAFLKMMRSLKPSSGQLTNGTEASAKAEEAAQRIASLIERAEHLATSHEESKRQVSIASLTKQRESAQKLGFISELYFVRGKVPFPTIPTRANYRKIVYESLMDPSLSKDDLDAYLADLSIILQDMNLERQGMRHNLVLATYAASNGPHSEEIAEFFRENDWVTKSYPLPRDPKTKKQIPPPKRAVGVWFLQNLQTGGAEKLEGSVATAGTIWSFWNFMTGRTVTEVATPATALAFSFLRKDAPFRVMPNKKYYRKIVLRFLMSPTMQPGVVQNFLTLLAEMSESDNPLRTHVHHNLALCAWGARNGPHGKIIRQFFSEHPLIEEKYSLPQDNPPTGWKLGSGAATWLDAHLIGSETSSDGMVVHA